MDQNKPLKKEDLVDRLLPVFGEILGRSVTREQVWRMFRACFGACASLICERQNLSLRGIGVFWLNRSQQSPDSPLRFKFRPSSRFADILNDPSRTFREEFMEGVSREGDPLSTPEKEADLGIGDIGDLH